MPVFPVYASFTSDIPKGIVVKPETTLSQFLEKANAKLNTSATIVCTRERMEIDEDEMLHELDSNTQLILCSSLDEFVPHVIQDQTSPESVHDPITSTPAILQVQDLNEACTSRPQSYMALLFDDRNMTMTNF
ncbi:uncharacterized protein LOC124811675 isoform X2 [Hydra vulgaris]|uniref:uncharacterized protein LOC124811675 isoform X2 n=1 Tax=Hydra vulgaris TaxID=6087 RepID=UPI001F5FC175|nr:uncharacterized protein LOC124811675 isoform X3 [Hydra vulgaris]